MSTLDRWLHLAAAPTTIECVKMALRVGTDGDGTPATLTGPGTIDVRSATEIDFTMFATPGDPGGALARLVRARKNPWLEECQFLLSATDYEGTQWSCGRTEIDLKGTSEAGWLLKGRIDSMAAHVSGSWVSPESGVELVFDQNLRLPMDETMTTVSSIGEATVQKRYCAGRQAVRVLDTEIVFFRSPSGDLLRVTARTSDALPHPYAENWIGEPLRVLSGQLVYPRLVARNFGDGTAHVWLRPSPPLFKDSRIASLLWKDPLAAGPEFWDLYASLLTMIADLRDKNGEPEFEPHPITRFYEEMIQATQGSKWVLCMTLASAAEGIAKRLMDSKDLELRFSEQDISSLRSILLAWKGDKYLRGRILGDIARAGESTVRSVGRFMDDLAKRGVLQEENVQSWSSIRNEVMHGNLVNPWDTEEEEKSISNLADLVHRLTHECVRRRANSVPKRESTE